MTNYWKSGSGKNHGMEIIIIVFWFAGIGFFYYNNSKSQYIQIFLINPLMRKKD